MLSKEDVLNRNSIDPMFARRLVDLEWSRENIIEKLVTAAHFGKMDCGDEIRSGPSWFFMECVAWLDILEDEELLPANVRYASEFFKDILDKYN